MLCSLPFDSLINLVTDHECDSDLGFLRAADELLISLSGRFTDEEPFMVVVEDTRSDSDLIEWW